MSANSTMALRVAIEAGQIMLSNGAETNRVEETIDRIMKKYTNYPVDSFVTPTGIVCTIEYTEDDVVTMVRRIKYRTINLEKIYLVHDLSKRLVEDKISAKDMLAELKRIKFTTAYTSKIKVFAGGLACAGFAQMFGGNLSDSVSAFITGFVLYFCLNYLRNTKLSNFMINIIGGMIATIVSSISMFFGIGNNLDTIIISSIMLLVPGLGLTNAIRDVLAEDYLSGSTRIIDATIVSICIAIGVGVGLGFLLTFN